MTYVKQTWANGPAGGTPISAARLAYMENGIANPVDSILSSDFLTDLGWVVNVKDYAATDAQRDAVGDGANKPLSGYYDLLTDAQVDYPHATAVTDELDSIVIQAAVNAAIGAGDPTNTNRACLNIVYVPPGTYRCNTRVHIQSVQGFKFIGAGRDITIFNLDGPTVGTLAAWLDIDGVANGFFGDFKVKILSGIIDRPISLDWSGTGITSRSSSSNVFANIAVSGAGSTFPTFGYKYAFAIGTRSGNRQVDNTSLYNCLATGDWTLDSTDTTLYQGGFQFGSGTTGNIIGNYLYDCSSVKNKYGVEGNGTNFCVYGSLPASNEVDFHQSGAAAATLINGVRSEGARRLWQDTGTAAVQTTSIRNVTYNCRRIASDGRWISENKAGHLLLDSVACTDAPIDNPSAIPIVYSVVPGSTPAAVTAIGLCSSTAIASAFNVGTSTALSVTNYTQTNPANNQAVPGGVTGRYTRNLTGSPSLVTARKTADQAIVNNTTTNITELVLPIEANQTMQFDAVVVYDSTTANDFQVNVTGPTGATIQYGVHGLITSATGSSGSMSAGVSTASGGNLNIGGARAAGAAAVRVMARISGVVVNGSNAGSVQVRGSKWQNTDATSPADDATVYANSHIRGVIG